jgi:peptide/nickel transport system permease protein
VSTSTELVTHVVQEADRVRRHPLSGIGILGWVALGVIVFFVLVALLAPWIAPYSPTGGSILDSLQAPSPQHLLGTDENGNDILSRLIWGARPSLLGPLLVVTMSLMLGVPLAIASAWTGGLVDRVIGRSLDLVFCFPSVLIASIIVLMFGQGLGSAVVAVSIAYIPWAARITRTAAIRERSRPYVVACEVQGLSTLAIAVRHLLPNLSPLIVAQATVAFGFALVDLAALSFIGLGIVPPQPDWGVMVGSTTALVQGSYNGTLAAGACIVIVVGAFTFLGNRLSENTDEV